MQCVKALLFHKKECAVNATNEQGDTPLHNAARWGFGELLHTGIYIQLVKNDTNSQSLSFSLSTVCHYNPAAIVQVLLQHDANTNVPNKRREIPQQCAQSRKVADEIYKLF